MSARQKIVLHDLERRRSTFKTCGKRPAARLARSETAPYTVGKCPTCSRPPRLPRLTAMTLPRSRSSKGSSPSAAAPACISAAPTTRALHHLAAEVIDNSMDEAVAGFATRIEVTLEPGNRLTVSDNGRGIPVDPHPKYPGKSALEVIMTTLHSGGKFEGKAYSTSGGLHGVGVSVVNALSTETIVEVARDKKLYRQAFSKGVATVAARDRRRRPQPPRHHRQLHPRPRDLRRRRHFLARSASTSSPAPRPICSPGSRSAGAATPVLASADVPETAAFQFPGGLADHLAEQLGDRPTVTNQPFTGRQDFPDDQGSAEWAVAWPLYSDGSESYYCNTIPTPDGGTHEAGLRAALTKGIRGFGDLIGNKKAKDITADDVFNGVELMLCVFIRNPHFQSQTKDRLTSLEAARFVEAAVRDHFDHYLADNMDRGRALLGSILERMDERLKRRAEREVQRKTATSAPQAPPPRQAHRLRQRRPRRHRAVHRRGRQRRRLGQAGAQPQDPGDPPHPRQDPQRRLAPRRQDPRQPGNRRPQPRARLRHPRQVRRGCAAL